MHDSIQTALSSPLFEDDSVEKGWLKSTVVYLVENRERVYKTIRSMVKNMRGIINSYDIDDMYQEIVEYMSVCEDYDICNAYSRRCDGNIVGIEGYVHSCIKFCIKRYITKSYKIAKNHVDAVIRDDDGDETSLLDYMPDKQSYTQYSDRLLNIGEICKNNEEKRYEFGVDIFTMFYIGLVLEKIDKRHKITDIMKSINVIGKELDETRIRAERDGIAVEMARAITKTDIDTAINEIGNYVYGKKSIDKLIEFTVGSV